MKNNFFRWFVVFITLMMAMSSISFLHFLLSLLFPILKQELLMYPLLIIFFLSIKMGSFKRNEIY